MWRLQKSQAIANLSQRKTNVAIQLVSLFVDALLLDRIMQTTH